MDLLFYISLGLFAYIIGSMVIAYRIGTKLHKFFSENPHSLPVRLPKQIQEIKNDLGEEKFNHFYKKFKEMGDE